MNPFVYIENYYAGAIHIALVSSGIKSDLALFEDLYKILQFPDYFGCNWNALNECLCDFSWISGGDIVLVHADIPLVDDPSSLLVYLSLLKLAVNYWNESGSRKFIVCFPIQAESTIELLLANSKNPW